MKNSTNVFWPGQIKAHFGKNELIDNKLQLTFREAASICGSGQLITKVKNGKAWVLTCAHNLLMLLNDPYDYMRVKVF